MGEDDIMELLWKSGQVVPSSLTQRPPTSHPPPILPGSGEVNAPLPQPQPQPPLHHHNLFIQEDEKASWLIHPNRQDYFCSGVASTPANHPQSSVSLAPPQSHNAPYGQIIAATRAENYMNFSTLRENIFTGGRVEAGQLMQVGPSTFPATESYLTPATLGTESVATFIGRVSSTFPVPGRGRKDKAVAIQTVCDIARTSSSCAETEPVQIQPVMEAEIADDRKRNEREETFATIQGTEEGRGSTSRKRSRVAEMHNLSERRRREKINEKMKTLQELIPRCNKNDKASMLDDVIEYVKTLQMQMMSMGYGVIPRMMNEANMQLFIPHMAMGMNRPPFVHFPGTPFPREAHMAGLSSAYPAPHYPFPNSQASYPSKVPLPSLQPGSNPVSNQPQFPAYMNPYSQFVGLHQMQQHPPPLQNQTTSQLSFGQASSSKEHEDRDNQPTA